jgi:hypothetical protein
MHINIVNFPHITTHTVYAITTACPALVSLELDDCAEMDWAVVGTLINTRSTGLESLDIRVDAEFGWSNVVYKHCVLTERSVMAVQQSGGDTVQQAMGLFSAVKGLYHIQFTNFQINDDVLRVVMYNNLHLHSLTLGHGAFGYTARGLSDLLLTCKSLSKLHVTGCRSTLTGDELVSIFTTSNNITHFAFIDHDQINTDQMLGILRSNPQFVLCCVMYCYGIDVEVLSVRAHELELKVKVAQKWLSDWDATQ